MAKQILIVDDDPTLVHQFAGFLTESGYEVVTAVNGEVALQKVQLGHPDLILLDIVMPKVNGYAFLFELRKIENGIKIPIIVISSKSEMADIFKAEGVVEYMVKPFSQIDLLEKVRKHI